jgi:hypothetical protein
MVPSSKNDFFLRTLRDVFDFKGGNFILPKDINMQTKKWINLIENKPWLNYNKSETIDGKVVRFDLCTTFENLLKIMYHFYSIGFDVKLDLDKFEVIRAFSDKLEMNITKIIEKPENAKDFWNKIFEYVSKKFSTSDRKVTFSVGTLDKNDKFEVIGNKVITSGSNGKVNVKIEYLKDDKKFNVNFEININPRHAFITSSTRSSSGLGLYERLKKLIFKKGVEPEVKPISILLANKFVINLCKENKTKNIFIYCSELKSAQGKYDFLNDVIIDDMLKDKEILKLVNILIDKITNDFVYITDLAKLLIDCDNKDLLDKLRKKKSGSSFECNM